MSLEVLNIFIVFLKIVITITTIFKSLDEGCQARGDVKISHKRQLTGWSLLLSL